MAAAFDAPSRRARAGCARRRADRCRHRLLGCQVRLAGTARRSSAGLKTVFAPNRSVHPAARALLHRGYATVLAMFPRDAGLLARRRGSRRGARLGRHPLPHGHRRRGDQPRGGRARAGAPGPRALEAASFGSSAAGSLAQAPCRQCPPSRERSGFFFPLFRRSRPRAPPAASGVSIPIVRAVAVRTSSETAGLDDRHRRPGWRRSGCGGGAAAPWRKFSRRSPP